MVYDLLKATEDYLTREKLPRKGALHYYPTEASVRVQTPDGPETYGACLRKAYLRCKGVAGKAFSPTTEFIFKLGDATEAMLIETWKCMGLWIADHVKWYDSKYNLSGEIDVVLKDPETGKPFIGEVKSFHGYQQGKALLGSKGKPGFPRMNHLLQTLLYKYEFPEIDYARIFYLGRDNAHRTSFLVRVVPDEQNHVLVHRPKIEEDILPEFTIEDILARYKTLDQLLKANTLPDREFELKYSGAKIEKLRKQGKISTLKYNKWKKCDGLSSKDWPGDYQCSWCSYKSFCYLPGCNPRSSVPHISLRGTQGSQDRSK